MARTPRRCRRSSTSARWRPSPRPGGDPERALVQVKAVDGLYPLYGAVELAGGASAAAERWRPGDGLPGTDRARRADRPARTGDRRRAAPRRAGLPPDRAAGERTGRRRVELRLRAAGDRARRRRWPTADCSAPGRCSTRPTGCGSRPTPTSPRCRPRPRRASPTPGCAGATAATARRASAGFIDRLGAFLVLMGLAGLAVGGVGVAAAVRAYLEGKTETIATLKTLGATGGDGVRDLSHPDRAAVAARDRDRPGARGGAAADRGAVRRRPAAGAGGVRRSTRGRWPRRRSTAC